MLTFGITDFLKANRWKVAFAAGLVILLVVFVTIMHGPNLQGDTSTYLTALKVMQGEPAPSGFMPNRIMTTFLPLEIIRLMAPVFGGVMPAWFAMNLTLYLLGCAFFYKLLSKIFSSEKTALIGGLFLAANYGFFLFGLNYLMDIGGWSFYIMSIYFLFEYSRSKRVGDIALAALLVGVGGLFKEYAFLGAVAIGAFLVVEHRRSFGLIAKRALQTAPIALIPTVILYAYVYHRFGYTYLDWFGANRTYYVYSSRLVEYVKALGSLVNMLAFMFLGGAYVLVRRFREIEPSQKSFVLAVAISFLPIFFWPAITQRILTITIPFIIIVSGFLFKRYEHRWYLFLPVFAVYVLMTLFMDSYILKAVNLPF